MSLGTLEKLTCRSFVSMGVYTASKTSSKLLKADAETGVASSCGCMPMEVVLARISPFTSPADDSY